MRPFHLRKVRAEIARRLSHSNGRRAREFVSTRAAYRGDESLHLGFKHSEFIAKFVTRRQKVARSAAGFGNVLADRCDVLYDDLRAHQLRRGIFLQQAGSGDQSDQRDDQWIIRRAGVATEAVLRGATVTARRSPSACWRINVKVPTR